MFTIKKHNMTEIMTSCLIVATFLPQLRQNCNFLYFKKPLFYAHCKIVRVFSEVNEKNFFKKNWKWGSFYYNSILARFLDDFENYIVLQSAKIAGHFYYNCNKLKFFYYKCGTIVAKLSSRTVGQKC